VLPDSYVMKHWFVLLSLFFLFVTGCRSSDTDRAASGVPAPEPPAVAPAQDAVSRDLDRSAMIWRWPERFGEPRDLASDHAECLQKADSQTSPMRRTGVLWDCMRQKGWQRVKGTAFNFDALKRDTPQQ
jgi:hypothetical protein